MLSLNRSLNRYNAMIPKIGTRIPALGIVLSVAGCATTGFVGVCAIQPVAAQGGVMLAKVACEKDE